jgi:mannosylglycerate hydrolase
VAAGSVAGYSVDGAPVRVIQSDDPGRVRMFESLPALDVELVIADVPAFGYRRIRLTPADASPDEHDRGRDITAGSVTVHAADDGTLRVRIGDRELAGLATIEHVADHGDSYDFDPVPDDPGDQLEAVDVHRHRHPSGTERLAVTRTMASGTVVRVEARVAPGIERVDLHVYVEHPAPDHRLRLCFPTGAPVDTSRAATTFDTALRSTAPVDDASWVHPAPRTFPHQGWVEANGLSVAAPGLPEAEVTADGVIAITVLRTFGWLARFQIGSRPVPAGPALPTPDGQLPGGISAELALRVAAPEAVLQADELGLRAVPAGEPPLLEPGASLLALEPDTLVLSTLKPGDSAECVLRVLNPTGDPVDAAVALGVPVRGVRSLRLDESPDDADVEVDGSTLRFTVGPHALRTIAFTPTHERTVAAR